VIAYFGTSALVPLLIAEPGSAVAGRLWDTADRVVSARLLYPEARAALVMVHRQNRLTTRQHRAAKRELNGLYRQLDIVEIDSDLAASAGDLAETYGLRGYDAVHLAAALLVHDPDVVLAAGDSDLLTAASTAGPATAAAV
jgi:predicted nucleic acid-binding protein